MTSPPPPTPQLPEPDDLDLAASDLIDGDRALLGRPESRPADDPGTTASRPVDGEPGDALAQRVERLRPVVDALREPVPPPATSIRDEQIWRALTQPGASAATSTAGPAASASTSDGLAGPEGLDQLARRRHAPGLDGNHPPGGARSGGRSPIVLAVAAAVLVLVVGAALVVAHIGSTSRQDKQVAATAGTAPGTTGDRGGATAGAPTAAPAAGTGPELDLAGLTNLGAAKDAAGLAALVQRHQATSSATGEPEGPGAQSEQASRTAAPAAPSPGCEAAVRAARGDLGALSLRARATLAGRPVEVLLFAPGTGSAVGRLVAVDPQTCEVLVDRPS
jgi:hypothetical protein